MKNVNKIANAIVNLSTIKSDFVLIKRKLNELEKGITSFKGESISWESIEVWKPLAEEAIEKIKGIMEKVSI
jgi:hypothetical protein